MNRFKAAHALYHLPQDKANILNVGLLYYLGLWFDWLKKAIPPVFQTSIFPEFTFKCINLPILKISTRYTFFSVAIAVGNQIVLFTEAHLCWGSQIY